MFRLEDHVVAVLGLPPPPSKGRDVTAGYPGIDILDNGASNQLVVVPPSTSSIDLCGKCNRRIDLKAQQLAWLPLKF